MLAEYFGIIVLVYVLSGFIFGAISCACCSNKNNIDGILGFLLGFLFGMFGFAITVAIVLSGIENNAVKKRYGENDGEHVDFCKTCGYQLFDDDTECPNCHNKRN